MKRYFIFCLLLGLNTSVYCQYVWNQKGNFPTNIYSTSFFTIGNKGYVGLGNNGTGQNEWWEYDFLTDTWTPKANYPIPNLWAAACFSINNKGYVISGTTGSYILDFYEFDPATNVWTQRSNFPGGARQDASYFTLNSYGYIACGFGGVYRNDLWEYDQNSNSWACLLYTSPSPRDRTRSRMPSSA